MAVAMSALDVRLGLRRAPHNKRFVLVEPRGLPFVHTCRRMIEQSISTC